jgi:hypothetical protein
VSGDGKVLGSVRVGDAHNSTIIGVQIQCNSEDSDLRRRVQEALSKSAKLNEPVSDSRSIFLIPPLPHHYVPRNDLLTLAANRVLEKGDPGCLRVQVLHGSGGSGKSTLAKALCYLPSVKQNFEIILWADLGIDAKPIEVVTRWVRILGEASFQPSSLQEASDRLRARLEGRRSLLVLDDVWSASDAEPFLIGSEFALLLTTRKASVADDLAAPILEVDSMSQSEALDLLQHWLGRTLRSNEASRANKLIESVDYLPLALELAGALLARGSDWEQTRLAFEAEAANVTRRNSQISRQLAKILGCIKTSVNELRRSSNTAWERFAHLGLTAPGSAITLEMAKTFWGTSASDADLTLQQLQDDALLQRTSNGWHIHDAIRDVALGILSSDPPAGLGVPLTLAHETFLNCAGWSRGLGSRSPLANDSYVVNHLTWHLEMAGAVDSIHELLGESNDEGECAWWSLLNSRNQVDIFLADVDRASRLALSSENSFPLLYRYAAIRASLATMVQSIAPQVLRSLVRNNLWDFNQGFAVAKQIHRREKAAAMFTDLAELSFHRSDPRSLQRAILAAMDAIPGIQDVATKARLAARLCCIASADASMLFYSLVVEWLVTASSGISEQRWRYSGLGEEIPKIVLLLPAHIQGSALTGILKGIKGSKRACKVAEFFAMRSNEGAADRGAWVAALKTWCEQRLGESAQSKTFEETTAVADSTSPNDPSDAVHGRGDHSTAYDCRTSTQDYEMPKSPRALALTQVALYSGFPETQGTVGSGSVGRTEDREFEADEAASRQDIEFVLIRLYREGLLGGADISPYLSVPAFKKEIRQDGQSIRDTVRELLQLGGLSSPYEQVSALAALKERIGDTLRAEAEQIAVSAVKKLWEWGVDPLEVFEQIGNLISAEARRVLAEELQGLAQQPRDDAGWHLASAARLSEHPETSLLKEAENRFRASNDREARDKTMALLIDLLDPRSIKSLMEGYQRIDDEMVRTKLRFKVAPHLGTQAFLDDIADGGGSERLRSLARMMRELVGTVAEPQLRSFVEAAADLVGDWWVVEALTDVLVEVSDEAVILKVLSVARDIGPADLRSRLASRAIYRLAECGFIGTALASTVRIELESERWAGLADSVERLAASGRFHEANLIADMINAREERGRAQAYISLHQARIGNLREAVEQAKKVASLSWREWVEARISSASESVLPANPVHAFPSASKVSVTTPLGSWVKSVELGVETYAGCLPLLQFIKTHKSGRPLAEFWSMVDAKTGKRFFDHCDGMLRLELMEAMGRIVPVLGAYGNRDDLIALEETTRKVGLWWP